MICDPCTRATSPQKSDLFLGGNPQALAFGAAIRRRQKRAAVGQKLGHRIRIKMIVMGVGDHQQVGLQFVRGDKMGHQPLKAEIPFAAIGQVGVDGDQGSVRFFEEKTGLAEPEYGHLVLRNVCPRELMDEHKTSYSFALAKSTMNPDKLRRKWGGIRCIL